MKMPHWPIPYNGAKADPSLHRFRTLLSRLGHPEKRLPPIIHVTGTNGKGSTIAYIKTILESAGYRVHRYISPHLINFNERIQICGQDISNQTLQIAAEHCRLAAGDIIPTFFEGSTAIAFYLFAETPADILLLEVGMGGATDATNVISDSLISVITPISMDHAEHIGPSITDIARAKAGIMRKDRQCVISWQPQEVTAILKYEALSRGSEPLIWNEDWIFSRNDEGFNIDFPHNRTPPFHGLPQPSLYGIHQYINAATAVVTALQLRQYYPKIRDVDIAHGISHTNWPARMQRITNGVLHSLLPSDSELWLDGAHNEGGAAMLAASLQQLPPKKLYLIHGRTKQRDIRGFLQHFASSVSMICCVRVNSEPLPETPQIIQHVAEELGIRAVTSPSLSQAVKNCLEDSAGTPCRIVICGSLYLAGDVLKSDNSE